MGKPTNHKQFNEATAILAGDGLLNLAYITISEDIMKTKESEMRDRKIKAFNEFALAVDRMIAGEYVDTEFEGKEISNEYLEYMHKNKTGALIKTSVRIGAILAEADEKNLQALTKYAESIGLAFQIKDDILSEIGDEKILGKPVGNDRQKQKITFVTKYGIEKAKQMLEVTIENGIKELDFCKEKTEFLKEIALYIKNREK
ncbi:MAG: polyprenyl synthetase family protein [Clostridia bacterium]|nr:polyprenyl synthetase family protein [Clostridia bacterium]